MFLACVTRICARIPLKTYFCIWDGGSRHECQDVNSGIDCNRDQLIHLENVMKTLMQRIYGLKEEVGPEGPTCSKQEFC